VSGSGATSAGERGVVDLARRRARQLRHLGDPHRGRRQAEPGGRRDRTRSGRPPGAHRDDQAVVVAGAGEHPGGGEQPLGVVQVDAQAERLDEPGRASGDLVEAVRPDAGRGRRCAAR
jgi:hypothetical protein